MSHDDAKGKKQFMKLLLVMLSLRTWMIPNNYLDFFSYAKLITNFAHACT